MEEDEYYGQQDDEQMQKRAGEQLGEELQGLKYQREGGGEIVDNQSLGNWSWGAGTHGQLATGAFRDELLPHPLLDFASFPIQSMACGGSHAAAVSKNGEAATWGNGQSGQLGHGHAENLGELTFVKALQSIKIRSVSAGWSHTAFVSEDQKLFTCGSGGFGQLGHGNFESCNVPIRVAGFDSMQVLMAACGMRHTLVLIDSGEYSAVYAFGSSKRGQLGVELSGQNLDKQKRVYHRVCLPRSVSRLNRHCIVSVHSNGDHSAALNDCGVLYLWGRGYDGITDIVFPSIVSSDLRFCQVALGWNHLLALTDDGLVYACGHNRGESVNALPNLSLNLHHENEEMVALNAAPGCSRSVGNIQNTEIWNISEKVQPYHWNPGLSQAVIESDGMTGSTADSRHFREAKTGSARQESYAFRLRLVEPLKEYIVRWVAAGSEHSAVSLDDRTVMTWGWGEHGQLGLGTTDDQSIPQKVHIISRMNGLNCRIFCGSGFTFVCMTF